MRERFNPCETAKQAVYAVSPLSATLRHDDDDAASRRRMQIVKTLERRSGSDTVRLASTVNRPSSSVPSPLLRSSVVAAERRRVGIAAVSRRPMPYAATTRPGAFRHGPI